MSYTYRIMSYNDRLLLSYLACFQENNIWMKGICQSKQKEITPDVSPVHSQWLLCFLVEFWLYSRDPR